MAKQVVCKSTCDRCKKPYEESAASPAQVEQGFGKEPPKLILECSVEGAVGALLYNDLCPKCTTRVADLVASIRLDKGEESTNNAEAKEGKPSDAPKQEQPASSSHKEGDTAAKKPNKPAATGTTTH